MNPYERRQRQGTVLCLRLEERVSRIALPGMDEWKPAWAMVGKPAADFLIALSNWEIVGDEATEDTLHACHVELVAAWADAASAYGALRGRTAR